jgi:hypothetical protein
MKMLKLVSLTAIVAMAVTAACSSDEEDGGGGGSGNTSGSGGSTGGAGGSGGSGGSVGGSGGSTGGSAGSSGGSAGSSGSAGSTSDAGPPACDPDAGVEAPKEGPNGECYTCKQVINFEPCALPPTSCGWDPNNPGPAGATKSAAKFFGVIGCMCNPANCEADCPEVCITQDFPSPKCKTCYEAACATELAACTSDDGA